MNQRPVTTQRQLTDDELHFAAIACDLYADEFPETISEDDPETAADVLRSASAKLMRLRDGDST